MALFMFWIFGISSVLIDADHLWAFFHWIPPIDIGPTSARCLHNPIFYCILSGIASIIVAPFINGYVAKIRHNLIRKKLYLLIFLDVGTFVFLYWFCETYAYRIIMHLLGTGIL